MMWPTVAPNIARPMFMCVSRFWPAIMQPLMIASWGTAIKGRCFDMYNLRVYIMSPGPQILSNISWVIWGTCDIATPGTGQSLKYVSPLRCDIALRCKDPLFGLVKTMWCIFCPPKAIFAFVRIRL